LSSVYNTSNNEKLKVININKITMDLTATNVYYELDKSGELDSGEVESIPLTLELKGIFVSEDHKAIEAANNIQDGLGIFFSGFCRILKEKDIFTQEDLDSIDEFLEQY